MYSDVMYVKRIYILCQCLRVGSNPDSPLAEVWHYVPLNTEIGKFIQNPGVAGTEVVMPVSDRAA
jgi:hypothetical protein